MPEHQAPSQQARGGYDQRNAEQSGRPYLGAHENLDMLSDACLPENAPSGTLILEYCDSGSLGQGIQAIKGQGSHSKVNLASHFLRGIAKGPTMIHHGMPDHTVVSSRFATWSTLCHPNIEPATILPHHRPVPGKAYVHLPRVVIAHFGCTAIPDYVLRVLCSQGGLCPRRRMCW